MESLVLNHPENLRFVVYALIFIGLFIEGEAIIFVSFYLVHQNYLDFFDTLFIIALGVFLNDLFWYSLGSLAEKNKLPFPKRLSGFVSVIDGKIKKNPFLTLAVSKFAYGFCRLTMVRMRVLKIPLRDFIKINMPVSFAWITLIVGISYAFSSSILHLKKYIKFAEVGLALAILAFLLIGIIISRISEKTLEKPQV